MNRPGRKRLSFDIPVLMFDLLKENADLNNITITQWMQKIIFKELRDLRKLEPL